MNNNKNGRYFVEVDKNLFYKSLTKEEKEIINTCSINNKNIEIVGSFSYPIQKYWSDIDLMEKVYITTNINTYNNIPFFDEIAKKITNLVYKIEQNPNYHIVDIKMGFNEGLLQLIDLGYTDDFGNSKGFNRKKINDRLKFLYNNKVLDKPLLSKINKTIDDNLNDIDKLDELLYEPEEGKEIIPTSEKDIDKYNPTYIGYLNNGKILDYNYNLIKGNIKYLYDNKSITKEQYNDINKLFFQNPNVSQWEELNEYLRNLLTLRWTPKDLYNGYIEYGKDNFFSLSKDDAVVFTGDNIIKIDIIGYVDNRYIEVSNFLVFYSKDKKTGKIEEWNISKDYFNNFEENIKFEIEKFFYSPTFYKPIKGIKRIFSLCKFINDKKTLDSLKPIIDSDYSLLSQINSNIDTLISLIEKVKNIDYDKIFNQIDYFKQLLYHVIDVKIDKNKLFDIIDRIISFQKEPNNNKIIELLDSIKKYINDVLTINIINFLYKIGWKKIPDQFLPKKKDRKYIITELKKGKIKGGELSLNSFISNLPFEAHMLDFSGWIPKKYSFCGQSGY